MAGTAPGAIGNINFPCAGIGDVGACAKEIETVSNLPYHRLIKLASKLLNKCRLIFMV